MGYVAVRGGGKAIEQSLKLLELERVMSSSTLGTDEIAGMFPDLIDQVMGEASLYAPRLAALALKQAQGSPDEAVFLLRSFRSTLERPYVSRPVNTTAMKISRRISAAFKDIPGGQILGATRDYSHRLLAFDLENEDNETLAQKRRELTQHFWKEQDGQAVLPVQLPRVVDYLRSEGLVKSIEIDNTQPTDATMAPLTFPASRSVRLQTLSRGMTQAVEALGYAAIRGFGPAHPTVGELRAGSVEITVNHPLFTGDADDAYYLGSIPVTEVESVFMDEDAPDQSSAAEEGLSLVVGYGLVMGRSETKAIAMSVLDRCLESGNKRYPTEDEEFVLYHVDGVEATGFISHLKLPHYVTFQSKLSSVRATHAEVELDNLADIHADAAPNQAKETYDASAL